MVRRKALLGSGEVQENHSGNTPPSKPGEDFHASERISRSLAQSPYVKMDDLERLLEETVRRGTEAALRTSGRGGGGQGIKFVEAPIRERGKIQTPLGVAGHPCLEEISAKNASRTIWTWVSYDGRWPS
ncbi:hypothetical protein Salat_2134700 [Sesamum alatum]|uniref:Uncharacterized protein n=1 Tax=Sesamum alatum TaxID=300844 RepID=A0AAE1Y131_9LAMI|nr:hypothetical protein Salat_2134700 [Sesamum alatum]